MTLVKQTRRTDDFLSMLAAPARRALEREGITTARKLSQWTERDIRQLHGMGPSTIPKLRAALKQAGLKFKEQAARRP